MIALHTVDSARETWRTITAEMLVLERPPKCRAFIAICCFMRSNTNTTSGLPYGMSNVTNPAFIQTAQFLYAQYPGIYKMRIKHKGRTRRSVMIRVYSGTGLQRTKACKGYSLASAVANLIQCIKKDRDLLGRLTHPERFVS